MTTRLPAGSLHLVCVGDLMVDVCAQLPGPLAHGSDTPAEVRLHGGGSAANVAAWALASGARATFVGRVGNDALGRDAVHTLEVGGVQVHAPLAPGLPTGTCIVLVDPAGERTMIPSSGANAAGPRVVDLPDSADWLYLSGYSLFLESARAGAVEILAEARRRRWPVAVDASSAAPLAELGADRFAALVGTGVLLFANAAEAQVLTGLAEPGAAAQALAQRFGTAVVKRGAAGAVWSDGSGVRSIAAVPVDVVDTTGAGDAFAAGLLTCSDGEVASLDAAVGLAARAVTRHGARPAPASVSGETEVPTGQPDLQTGAVDM